MKLYLLLFLFVIDGIFADKKINLDDIERDNLQSEAQTDEENGQPTEELKYSSSSQNPSSNLQYNTDSSQIIGGQQLQQIKYVQQQPETYNPQNSYSNLQSQRPQQFYSNNYQTEEYQSQKEVPQVSYQPQELSYQSEIPVGNLIQSYQQRIATQKFNQGIGKGEADYSIAAGKQLVYFTNSGIDKSSKTQNQPLLHQLASQAVKNARIPASYTIPSSLPNSHQPQVSYQPQPQIQYIFEPQYILQPTPTYSPKNSQDYTYTNQQTYLPSQGYSGLTYNPPSQVYTQPKQAYTQAYYIPNQLTQYYQEPAYYHAPLQSGNSLTYPQPESYYVPSKLSQQITTSQIPKRPASHGIPQNFAKIPQKPQYTLTLPQIPAQHFKSGVTHLRPVSNGYSHIGSSQNHYSSGPRSLLDSYTPSVIIAARDIERYRERPLHLESGFLPSKASFAHSYNQKRKSE